MRKGNVDTHTKEPRRTRGYVPFLSGRIPIAAHLVHAENRNTECVCIFHKYWSFIFCKISFTFVFVSAEIFAMSRHYLFSQKFRCPVWVVFFCCWVVGGGVMFHGGMQCVLVINEKHTQLYLYNCRYMKLRFYCGTISKLFSILVYVQ